MRVYSCFLLLLLVLGACGKSGEEIFVEKHLVFPPDVTVGEKVSLASRLIPSAEQLAWQEDELVAFIRFGLDTFSAPMADGTCPPASLFAPTHVDVEQWVRVLQGAGFKHILISAKQKDGFCLWLTDTTKYSVASSEWKRGYGNLVQMLRNACDKYGMGFGVSLSLADAYFDLCHDQNGYNGYFLQQLSELSMYYGDLEEIWLENALDSIQYDWKAFKMMLDVYQPNTLLAGVGDDIRQVVDYTHDAQDSRWCVTVSTPITDIGSRTPDKEKKIGFWEDAAELFWCPLQVDVSLYSRISRPMRGGQNVKSLDELINDYFNTVGHNSIMALTVLPTANGEIHPLDSIRLAEFASYRERMYANDLVIDGDKGIDLSQGGKATYKLVRDSAFNVVMLQEDIVRGQRVEAFTVEAKTKNGWEELAHGTTIGNKRLLRVPPVQAKRLRVTTYTRASTAHISKVAAYWAE